MSEWDSLTLDDAPSSSTSSSRAAAVADIDAILKRKKRADQEAVSTSELLAGFDDIGRELAGGEAKYEWMKDKQDTLENDFDEIAGTMDALEVQDSLLDEIDTGDGQAALQAHYKANIQKLTGEIERMGRATEQINAATNSSGQKFKKVTQEDAGSLGDAMASVNALLMNSAPMTESTTQQKSNLFTSADNLPFEKLQKLKPVVVSGINELQAKLSSIKDQVMSTADLSLAVSLTAPIAGCREDFHLLAKLCERPTVLPKLELANIQQYKLSVSRLVIAMKSILDSGSKMVDAATPKQSTAVVRTARIVSTTRKRFAGENVDN